MPKIFELFWHAKIFQACPNFLNYFGMLKYFTHTQSNRIILAYLQYFQHAQFFFENNWNAKYGNYFGRTNIFAYHITLNIQELLV